MLSGCHLGTEFCPKWWKFPGWHLICFYWSEENNFEIFPSRCSAALLWCWKILISSRLNLTIKKQANWFKIKTPLLTKVYARKLLSHLSSEFPFDFKVRSRKLRSLQNNWIISLFSEITNKKSISWLFEFLLKFFSFVIT